MLWKLVLMQPQLLLGHAKNYATFLSEGIQQALQMWRVRVVLYLLSAAFLGMGILCCAMALLLWGALPLLNALHSWMLLALPACLLIVGVLFYAAAVRHTANNPLNDLREQFQLDMLAIEQAYEK